MKRKPAKHSRTRAKPRLAAQGDRLRDRLAAARRRLMVGRDAEIALFRRALAATRPPFAVLHVHGPGGIGKTTLLRAYRDLAVRACRPVAWIEGSDLDPSPESFLHAARAALDADIPSGAVVFVDGYEYLAPLDGWLRTQFLPGLPARCIAVFAGREPPAAAWRAETEWLALTRIVALRNLDPAESKAYLRRRRVAAAHHEAALAFTHGHPLAISLVADVLARRGATSDFDPREQPDILRTLIERLVRDTPGPEYRRALEVCAHARATTESLLAHALETRDAPVIFEWLRGLSLVEHGPHGLVPHDLVREVLEADLRWRDPDGYRQLHRRVRAHVLERLATANGAEQQQAFFDLIYLHRGSSVMRPYYSWKTLGTAYAEPANAQEHATLVGLVRALEGDAATAAVRHWLARQPQAFYAFRGRGGETFGYAAMLALRETSEDDLANDDVLRRLHAYAQRTAALRPGEALLLSRYWAKENDEAAAAAANLIAMLSTRAWLTTPALAWAFAVPRDPDYWRPVFAHLNFAYLPEADFERNGRRYGAFAHDWRAEPPAQWLENMAEREIAEGGAPPPPPAPARLVLSQPDFAEAVRQALRDYTRPAALAANPLLRSRVLLDRTPATPSAADLQALLREGVAALRANPKDEKRYRALWHTFFEPASSQERAAERLRLAFNTYRYHLYHGIDAVTEWLWQRELHGSPE